MIPDPYTANLENITAAKRIAEQVLCQDTDR